MASYNMVVLVGNCGKEPELRYLPSGDPVANFSLAVTESWKDKSGQRKEETTWVSVEVFGKTAEIVRDYVTRGKQILVQGALKTDEWVSKDGEKKSKTKVKVSGPNGRLVLLGSRGESKPAADQGADVMDEDGSVPF